MATIVKTPSGTWKAVIRKKGWPTTAKTFRTKRDAQDWGRQTEDEMVRGVYIRRASDADLTLSEALDTYLSEITPTKKEATRRREKGRAEQLRGALGDYSLNALNPKVIAKYRDARLAEGKSNNTVRLELALLGHLFTVAGKEWGIALPGGNPMSMVRRPAPGAGRNRRLSWNETKRLLKSVDAHSNPMLGWITRIALYTAMRQGEILGLEIHQVDIRRRIVRLSTTKNHDARTVPLSRRATKVFSSALANPVRPKECPLVFFGEPGRRDKEKRGPYTINKIWAEAVKRACIPNLTFHDLRHEAVSRFVEKGLSDQEVASISGHRSMQMLKRYTHLRAEDLVAKLN